MGYDAILQTLDIYGPSVKRCQQVSMNIYLWIGTNKTRYINCKLFGFVQGDIENVINNY
jgi:hypothetical protein